MRAATHAPGKPQGTRRKTQAKLAQGTVTSDIRALRLLEYFSHVGGEVTLTEVARALNIPTSSTSNLLTRLVESGYVGHDAWRRVYYPTARAALISLQLVQKLPYGAGVLDLMGRLSEISRGTVFLSTKNRNSVQTIHIVAPLGGRGGANGLGAKYPIVTSTPGRMILASAPGTQVYGLVRRHNAEVRTQHRVNLRSFLDGLAEVRERGFALSRRDELPPQRLDAEGKGAPSVSCSFHKKSRVSVALPTSSWLDTLTLTLGFPQAMDSAQELDFAEAARAEVGDWISDQRHTSFHFPARPAPVSSARLVHSC